MKRCPQCNRIATDSLLAFCRVDGARLVQDSGSVIDSETIALLPDTPAVETSAMHVPPSEASLSIDRSSLSRSTGPTRKLIKRTKRGNGVVAIAAIVALALVSSAYFS